MRLNWLLSLMLATVSVAAPAIGEERQASFERAYAPIVQRHCLSCHGDQKPKAGLNLGRRASVLEPAIEGEDPAVVPRKPKESRLLQRVADGSMPPEDEGPPLTAKEVDVLRAWIEAGADWPANRVLRAKEAADAPPPETATD